MAIRKKMKTGTAAQRALEILEAVAKARRPVSGNEIMAWVRLPKPTVYRTCTLLEAMGMVQREPDSKKLTVGSRLCALALEVIQSSPNRGPIHAILQTLASDLGETCTFTILDGNEIVCVDRVESKEPLRIQLHAGSRIPLHCSASGKLFLSLIPRALSRRLIESAPLKRFTPNTIIDPRQLEKQLLRIRKEKISRDNQEFSSGLIAIAVPVTGKRGRICGTVSVNAPATRMTLDAAEAHVPALRRAARAIAANLVE
jgi:IclR family transcriptional regulator, acetate operon repressor